MKTSFLIFVLVVILRFQVQSSIAQPNHMDIKGYILDKMSGEALPSANVTVKGMNIGTTSNTEGYFIFVNPPPGIDTLEVFYIGYLTKTVSLSDKNLSEPIIIEMKQNILETETITVKAEEYQIWKAAEEVSQITFSPMQISALPNLGGVEYSARYSYYPELAGWETAHQAFTFVAVHLTKTWFYSTG